MNPPQAQGLTCPLLSAGASATGTPLRVKCLRERCAFWDRKHNECAIAYLAVSRR